MWYVPPVFLLNVSHTARRSLTLGGLTLTESIKEKFTDKVTCPQEQRKTYGECYQC